MEKPDKRFGQVLRVLRPLIWWLLLVLVLYGIRTHERLMEQTRLFFTITLNGRAPTYPVSVTLDGRPFISGENLSLFKHRLEVTGLKTDSFATNLFIIYRGMNLGDIKLRRSTGTLSIQANPAASVISIVGPEYSTTLHGCPGTNLVVPTDDYTVHVEYPRWSQSQNAVVSAGQMTSREFSPSFGSLYLTCNRSNATYRLVSRDQETRDQGDLPKTITGLPAGEYGLAVSFHNRQLQKSVTVLADATNTVSSEFVLGSARIESVPAGSSVSTADGTYLGQTPLDLPDLSPQTLRLKVSLPGYEPISANVAVAADQTARFTTHLVSINYLSAIQAARAALTVSNYAAAVTDTTDALSAKPKDTEAMALRDKANMLLLADQKRLERLDGPKRVFDALCNLNADASLFAEHELITSKPAKEVADAIAKSLQTPPSAYQVEMNNAEIPDTYRIRGQHTFSLGILGGTEQDCLVVVGQSKDDETQVWYKLVEYKVKHTIVGSNFSLHDHRDLVPMHPSRMQLSAAMLSQMQEDVKTVVEKIQTGN